MRDVAVGHDKCVIADTRDPVAFVRARVYRAKLADSRVFTDANARVFLGAVAHVLRDVAHDGIAVNFTALADMRVAHDPSALFYEYAVA